MAVAVAEAGMTVPELHISEEALLEAKIKKLAVGVRDDKAEVARV